jgi:hypothetical protein
MKESVSFHDDSNLTILIWYRPAKNVMPQDVVDFLEQVFGKEMSQWKYDPGYASRVTGLCPPPTNSKILVKKKKKKKKFTMYGELEIWVFINRDRYRSSTPGS